MRPGCDEGDLEQAIERGTGFVSGTAALLRERQCSSTASVSRPIGSSGPAARGSRACSPTSSACASRDRTSTSSELPPAGRRRRFPAGSTSRAASTSATSTARLQGEPGQRRARLRPGLEDRPLEGEGAAGSRLPRAPLPRARRSPARRHPLMPLFADRGHELPDRAPSGARERLAARRRLRPRFQARAGARRVRAGPAGREGAAGSGLRVRCPASGGGLRALDRAVAAAPT